MKTQFEMPSTGVSSVPHFKSLASPGILTPKRHVLIAFACVSLLWLAFSTSAQSISPIYSFTNGPVQPYGDLVQGPDGSFYGTTFLSGSGQASFDKGIAFRVTTNGVVTTLVNFTGANGSSPFGGLVLGGDGNLYGTTSGGGTSGLGTVFRLRTNGTLIMLASFNGTNGANPDTSLVLGGDGKLYGTTPGDGTDNQGTVFRISTNGTLEVLATFNGTNGANPQAPVTPCNDHNFYGTTYQGGTVGGGVAFRVTTNGTFTVLANFSDGNTSVNPDAGLALGKDGKFYGTSFAGGDNGIGTIFQLTTNGALTTLASF